MGPVLALEMDFLGRTLTGFGDGWGRGSLEHEHEVEYAEEDGAQLDERQR